MLTCFLTSTRNPCKKMLPTVVHTYNASLHRHRQVNARSLVRETTPKAVLYLYIYKPACTCMHRTTTTHTQKEQIGFPLCAKAVKTLVRNLPCFIPSFFFSPTRCSNFFHLLSLQFLHRLIGVGRTVMFPQSSCPDLLQTLFDCNLD